jgi:hypothetical protein
VIVVYDKWVVCLLMCFVTGGVLFVCDCVLCGSYSFVCDCVCLCVV